MMKVVRSIIAVFIGLMLISILVEGIEFGLVSLLNGGMPSTEDPEAYFAIRNQTGVLLLKLFYNTIGAVIGGYVTGWISGEHPRHGFALAIIQTIALIYGMFSEFGVYTPIWMWILLILLTFPAIISGSYLRNRQRIPSPA